MEALTGYGTPKIIQFSVKRVLPIFVSILLLSATHKMVYQVIPIYSGLQLIIGLTLLIFPLYLMF